MLSAWILLLKYVHEFLLAGEAEETQKKMRRFDS
jgi:hypothetical protein